jgi:hypothetical protein
VGGPQKHICFIQVIFQNKKNTSGARQHISFLYTPNFFFFAHVPSEKELQILTQLTMTSSTLRYQEELKKHSFTILDTSEGQVFIDINHYGRYATLGNIHMSDSTRTPHF